MENKLSLTPVKRFFNLLRVDKEEIVSIYIYAIFSGLVNLSLPLGIQAIINFISGGQTSTSWIVLVVLVVAAVAFSGILQVMHIRISENLQQKIFTRSAFEFAYRIPRLKLEMVDKSYVPELVNRFFDTLSIQKGLSKLLMDFSTASLQVIFGLILLSLYHPFFILFSLVIILIVYLIFRFTAPRGLKTSIIESKYKYEVAHWLEEVARAMETFKLAGKSPLPLSKTDEAVQGYLTARKAHFKTLLVQYINLVGFKTIVAAGLLVMGSLLVINQQMNIGQFVAAEIIIILVLNSVEKLIMSMETIYDVLTAIEKIGAVTDIELESDKGEVVESEDGKGLSLVFNNVSFKQDEVDRFGVKDLTFNIEAGEKVCVAGKEDSGKSLLLQLMAGLYENYNGLIKVNNIPLGNWNLEKLRSEVGDSLAKEDVIQGTFSENIGLGKPNITFRKIQEVAKICGLDSYIEKLPGGYDTILVSEGKNMPKSIRQKIMLARSIASSPKLILLEENFNYLEKTDKLKFLEFVLDSKQTWTVVAISNDLETAKMFNRVIFLNEGKKAEEINASDISSHHWFKN